MRWYRDHWFLVGGILFVIEAYILAIWGEEMDMLLKFMIMSVMALHVHQFEEYAIPGGFPIFNNIAFMGEKELPDRVPLSKKGAFVCNVCCMYPVYILALIFHKHIWVGLCVMLFGVAQFLVHGIMINRKAGTVYNPGLASVILLFFSTVHGLYHLYLHKFHRSLVGLGTRYRLHSNRRLRLPDASDEENIRQKCAG